jgi:hypothetical protein
MSQDANNHESQPFVTLPSGTPTQHSRAGMSETIESGSSGLQFPPEAELVPRTWHKLYAEALQEIDPSKITALISAAERAILNRSVEIQCFPTPIEENRDLESALHVLSRLRKSEMKSDNS